MPGKANTINHKEENTGMEIKGKVHYVGVNDRNKTLFENLWPLPYGVSYNSYLIDDEMVALVDTVDVCYFEVYLKKIRSIIGDRPINYLIINHMEPDHSGSISLIKQYYPNIVIVGNKKTFDMVEGFYGVGGERYVVGEGDFLALGHHKLRFSLIPMVHWPETMMTYAVENKTLFSGDAFGCFGALNGGIIDEEMDTSLYFPEMTRYYSNIVGKYGLPVQKALQKLSGVAVDYICSTHGPVWHRQATEVIGIYGQRRKRERRGNSIRLNVWAHRRDGRGIRPHARGRRSQKHPHPQRFVCRRVVCHQRHLQIQRACHRIANLQRLCLPPHRLTA